MVIEMWEMTATTAPNVLIDDMQPASGLPRNIHHHPMECCMVIAMQEEIQTNEGSQQGPSSSYWTMHVFDDSANTTCAVKGADLDVIAGLISAFRRGHSDFALVYAGW